MYMFEWILLERNCAARKEAGLWRLGSSVLKSIGWNGCGMGDQTIYSQNKCMGILPKLLIDASGRISLYKKSSWVFGLMSECGCVGLAYFVKWSFQKELDYVPLTEHRTRRVYSMLLSFLETAWWCAFCKLAFVFGYDVSFFVERLSLGPVVIFFTDCCIVMNADGSFWRHYGLGFLVFHYNLIA